MFKFPLNVYKSSTPVDQQSNIHKPNIASFKPNIIDIYFILEGAGFFTYSYFCFLLFFYKYIAISYKL